MWKRNIFCFRHSCYSYYSYIQHFEMLSRQQFHAWLKNYKFVIYCWICVHIYYFWFKMVAFKWQRLTSDLASQLGWFVMSFQMRHMRRDQYLRIKSSWLLTASILRPPCNTSHPQTSFWLWGWLFLMSDILKMVYKRETEVPPERPVISQVGRRIENCRHYWGVVGKGYHRPKYDRQFFVV